MEPIDVVLFERDFGEQDTLHHWLRNNDWSAEFIDGDDYLASTSRRSAGITLVVLGDGSLPTASLQERLENRLLCGPGSIKLCLVKEQQCPFHTDFFSNFDDFIFWPCSAREFSARLSRFVNRPPADVSAAARAGILDEFAAMNLSGVSAPFVALLGFIKKIARCDATVLIEGETGTGKENAARAIHYLSTRRDHAFIPVNCGAIPDNLLENELFGHDKGAFTDARSAEPGLVELAAGGTLFLDEVDSLSSKAQAALLRFLQTHEFRPLGSRCLKRADVRIVAATNADLPLWVKEKRFREDLLFRLNVLSVQMPPLRDRPEDIGIIANSLLMRFAKEYGRGPRTLHAASLRWLKAQPWPGNVRELENVLLREFLLEDGPILSFGLDGTEVSAGAAIDGPHICRFHEAKEAAINAFEAEYLHKVLEMTAGNVTAAARIAGKERRAFGKLVKKYNIDKNRYGVSCDV